MMERANKAIGYIRSLYWLWTTLFSLLVSASVPAWAVYYTNVLAEYAPASWIISGLLGTLVASLIYWLTASARDKWVRATEIKFLLRASSNINPLLQKFDSQRIKISELVSPVEPYIKGKTFTKCEIIGPANIIMKANKPGSGNWINCRLIECAGVVVNDSIPLFNVVVIEDCHFIDCTIYRCLLFTPSASVQTYNEGMAGMQWITPMPPVGTRRRSQTD